MRATSTKPCAADRTLEVGKDSTENVDGERKIEVTKTSKLSAKKEIVLNSEDQIVLKAGLHPIAAAMFESGGREYLRVEYAGPGIGRQLIPKSVLHRAPPR